MWRVPRQPLEAYRLVSCSKSTNTYLMTSAYQCITRQRLTKRQQAAGCNRAMAEGAYKWFPIIKTVSMVPRAASYIVYHVYHVYHPTAP